MNIGDGKIILELSAQRIEKLSDIIIAITSDVGIIKQNIKELIQSNKENKKQQNQHMLKVLNKSQQIQLLM